MDKYSLLAELMETAERLSISIEKSFFADDFLWMPLFQYIYWLRKIELFSSNMIEWETEIVEY
jgi:hypothetical protein